MSTEIEFVPDPSGTVNRPGMPWSATLAQPVSLNPGFGGPTMPMPDFAVPNIAALRVLTGYYGDQCMTVEGLLTSFDGLGGHYIFDSVNTDADDGVTIVTPNDITAPAPGRWKKY